LRSTRARMMNAFPSFAWMNRASNGSPISRKGFPCNQDTLSAPITAMSKALCSTCFWRANRGPRKRVVKVTEQKTSKDWAHCMQEVIDVHYPKAEKIILVMDTLATHSPAALYHAFPPAQARRLAAKLEIHHTPLHGSWLNMAEIEFAALARQCLPRRITTCEELEHQVACWQEQRNDAATAVNWRFTTADARIKLKRLYPSLKTKTTDSEQESVANLV
jgi:hypothetical protein